MAHHLYLPEGSQEGGRCVSCHMVPTASTGFWSELSGVGDLSSHSFLVLSPEGTLDVFDTLGVSELDPGLAPPHSCADCHAWNGWYFESLGLVFPGPYGDASLVETHEAYLAAWQEIYP